MVGVDKAHAVARRSSRAHKVSLRRVLESLSWTLRQFATQPDRFYQSLKVVLESLRYNLGMDAVELFLADPQRRWLSLTSYHGTHPEAFAERPSFAWGEGYPGLVASQLSPLVTHDLSNDPRYLRNKVKALGYHTYICFPLSLGEHFIGVVNLASRDPQADDELVLELLEVVAPLLAAGVFSVFSRKADSLTSRINQTLQGVSETTLEALLEEVRQLGGAHCAALYLRGGERYLTNTDKGWQDCPWLSVCPVWQGEIRTVPDGAMACPHVKEGSPRYCLPLWSKGEVVGVQSLHFMRLPRLPSRAVAPVLWLEHLATPLLEHRFAGQKPWLEITTFGSFQVRRNGMLLNPKAFKRQQAYTLLKLLVAHRGLAFSYDELTERLWPEVEPDPARLRLQVAVHTLRGVIEPEPQHPQIILSEGQTYRFDPKVPYRLDVEDFKVLIRQGDKLTGLAALGPYRQALELYQGDFLAEERYSDWCELDRSYFRERAIRALERSAGILTEHRRFPEALEIYRQLVQLDPWHETAYLALARLLRGQGRAAEAHSTLRNYCAQLEHEGLPLSPELMALLSLSTSPGPALTKTP